MAIHIHIGKKKAKDAVKYVSNIDIRLPNGKVVPNGTVFYKIGPNLYRPYFARPGESDVRISPDRFVIEDSKAKDATPSAFLKKHPMWSESDYSYFKNKGYTDKEILALWDRDQKSGGGPVNHKPIPNVLGRINGKIVTNA
jgi:hypothetical protein